MTPMDIFVIVTGSFTVLITVPMIMLAMWSRREAGELRNIQNDLVALMEESRRLAEESQHGSRSVGGKVRTGQEGFFIRMGKVTLFRLVPQSGNREFQASITLVTRWL